MMVGGSGTALFVLMVLVVPFVWSALVWGMRILSDHRASPVDGRERLALALMIVPAGAGLLQVFLPDLVPDFDMPLPPIGEPMAGGHGTALGGEPVHREEGILLPLAVRGGLLVYGAGLAVGVWRLGQAVLRMRRLLRRADPVPSMPDLCLTDEAVPPFAAPGGKVVLPRSCRSAMSDEEWAMVIAHERAHLGRRDPVWFLGLASLDVIFWFNPFLRMQTARCRLAAELDCDARVLGASPQMRKAYAAVLLKVLKHTAGHAPTCAPAALSPRPKGDIRVRIEDILHPRGRSRNRRAVAALAALGLAVAPLSAWQLAHAADAVFTVRPVEGRLTSPYGMRVHPVEKTEKMHQGTDIAAPLGTPVYAPANGKVLRVILSDGGYGNMLELDHGNGVITRYAQLDSIAADGKKTVAAGEVIARVGASGRYATGPHLHVEVIVDGQRVDPASVLDLPSPSKD